MTSNRICEYAIRYSINYMYGLLNLALQALKNESGRQVEGIGAE